MCRHLGYLGPSTTVAEIITAGEHSLRTQSWAPTDMRQGGTVNADGFGAAWWPDGGVERAVSYRNAMPIWSDPAVDDVLSQIRSTAVLAAVRSATVGMPVVHTACAPFVSGRWAFSHNGVVRGWPRSMSEIAAEVPTEDLLLLDAPTDSAALWVVLRALLRDHDPEDALLSLVRRVDAAAPDSRLNLLLSDGRTIWATALYHSLWVFEDDAAVLVASEPTDSRPGWRAVPDRSIVVARVGSVIVRPLDSTE